MIESCNQRPTSFGNTPRRIPRLHQAIEQNVTAALGVCLRQARPDLNHRNGRSGGTRYGAPESFASEHAAEVALELSFTTPSFMWREWIGTTLPDGARPITRISGGHRGEFPLLHVAL
jgi:hypothetical protein